MEIEITSDALIRKSIEEISDDYLYYLKNYRIKDYSVKFCKNSQIIITFDNDLKIYKTKEKEGKHKTEIEEVFNDIKKHLENLFFYEYIKWKNSGDIIFKENYLIKSEEIPVYFIYFVHLIGIYYIEKIENMSNEEIKKFKINAYDEKTRKSEIVSEYIKLTTDEGNFKFMNRDKKIDQWCFKNDHIGEYSVVQKVNMEPTYIELLGCFVKEEHAVYICEDNIKKTAEKLRIHDNWFDGLNTDIGSNYDIFRSLVILHEIGHSIFQYTPRKLILDETRANYFSSWFTKGKYDYHIDCLTKFQPFIYKFPLLSAQYENIKKSRKNSNYDEELKLYNKKVDKLYEI